MIVERVEKHSIGRMGTANEDAEACLFSASDKTSFITGINLLVDK